MKLIHYSNEIIPVLEHRDYAQEDLPWQAKPNGFWVSVETQEDGHYNWKEWCEDEKYCLENLKYPHEVILIEDANILHLKTAQEILDFSKKYPSKIRDPNSEWDT